MANCIKSIRKAINAHLDVLDKSIAGELDRARHDGALLALKEAALRPDRIAAMMNKLHYRKYSGREVNAYAALARRRIGRTIAESLVKSV
jgi:hypothetical protein